MNETEIRSALHGVMTVVEQPAAMDADRMVAAARQARRRRQNVASGAGAVAAVAVATTTAVLVASGGSGSGSGSGITPADSSSSPTAPPTERSWPNGQTDRTAPPSEQEYLRAEQLMQDLTDSRPQGFTAPTDLRASPANDRFPLRMHQANFDEYVAGGEVWEYLADAPIAKDSRTGRLLVEVTTPGTHDPSRTPCDVAQTFWSMKGPCVEVDVDGKKVGVVTKPGRSDFDQWASYVHPDGTVVHLAQSKQRLYSDLPPLTKLPFTKQQLAELATDQRFHIK